MARHPLMKWNCRYSAALEVVALGIRAYPRRTPCGLLYPSALLLHALAHINSHHHRWHVKPSGELLAGDTDKHLRCGLKAVMFSLSSRGDILPW